MQNASSSSKRFFTGIANYVQNATNWVKKAFQGWQITRKIQLISLNRPFKDCKLRAKFKEIILRGPFRYYKLRAKHKQFLQKGLPLIANYMQNANNSFRKAFRGLQVTCKTQAIPFRGLFWDCKLRSKCKYFLQEGLSRIANYVQNTSNSFKRAFHWLQIARKLQIIPLRVPFRDCTLRAKYKQFFKRAFQGLQITRKMRAIPLRGPFMDCKLRVKCN